MVVLTAAIILLTLAVAGALFAGIGAMARNGEYDRRYSGRFMLLRVGLQGLALLLLFIVWFVTHR